MRADATSGNAAIAAARQRHIDTLRAMLQATSAVEQGLRGLPPEELSLASYYQMRSDYISLNTALRELLTATIDLLEAEAERERRHPQCHHPHAD